MRPMSRFTNRLYKFAWRTEVRMARLTAPMRDTIGLLETGGRYFRPSNSRRSSTRADQNAPTNLDVAQQADAVTAVPRFAHPSDLWGTERLLSLRIFAAGDFTVTLRFDWQDPSDPHEITFYVEGGACITHTADG